MSGPEYTQNPCVVCAPLGATIAFAGVRKGTTLLHGSQGCATYIRRYTISHFREPLDTASSSFTEETAVFGGKQNLKLAFDNLVRQYEPEFVGVATTCLAETIGEDAQATRQALADRKDGPLVATVSTPSYRGNHREGFKLALRAIAKAASEAGLPLASREGETKNPFVAVFPALFSPADFRYLKEAFAAFGINAVFVSDYSETLDGGPWMDERLLPEGGTPIEDLRRLPWASASIEFGSPVVDEMSGAAYLESAYGVKAHRVALPIGVRATDEFLKLLSQISGKPVPEFYLAERSRLLDAYVDAHKTVFGKRTLLYGDADIRDAVAQFLTEIGAVPVVSESRSFADSEEGVWAEGADLAIGSSKGYKSAKKLGVPLVRVGFPVHDRFGAQRIRLLGYGGTQELFDRIANALIEKAQEENDVGYTYY
jgi:nitrogenase molybdenum-iron protein NifN